MKKKVIIGCSIIVLWLFIIYGIMIGQITRVKEQALMTENHDVLSYKRIEIYAHRGGRGLEPENTMPAYYSALNQGVDYVDMDVGITKDGVIVVTHELSLDPDLTRYRGEFIKEATPISMLTYQAIQQYDVGSINQKAKYAQYFPEQRQLDHVKIPSLKEVIQEVKAISGGTVGFQIEIKTDPKKADLTVTPEIFAQKLYQVLKEEGVIKQTEVQAFDFKCLLALQKLDKNLKTAYLTDYKTDPKTGDKKTLWTAGYDVSDYHDSFPQLIKALRGHIWGPYQMDLTKKDLDDAHRLGLKVVVWGWPEEEGTEFNQNRMVELMQWGVDGIITDRPDKLRNLLKAHGYLLPKSYKI